MRLVMSFQSENQLARCCRKRRTCRSIAPARLLLLLSFLLYLPSALITPGHTQSNVRATPSSPTDLMLKQIGFDQKLEEQVPLNLEFKDETGKSVRLKDYFGKKPVVLVLGYYECPMLCTLVLTELTKALRMLNYSAGDEFNVVTVSINPRETPELAAGKKRVYLKEYGRRGAEKGWHFLVGKDSSIKPLAKAVGFRYAYDAEAKQYAHAAGIMILTPKGKVSRYLYGVEYSPKSLRFGLMEASENKIGSPVERLLLFCYHYDPKRGRYSFAVMNVVRLACLATLFCLGSFIVGMLKKEKRGA